MSSERKKLRYVYDQMRKRCLDPKNPAFKNYGGRGISVSQEWLASIDTFIADMGPRPPGGLLDRQDNNQGYSSHNCIWSNRKTQNSNRRNCILVDDADTKITLKEFCRRRFLPYQAVRRRIQDRGWTIDRALNEPIHIMPSNVNRQRSLK
jgi:hypothetical protein